MRKLTALAALAFALVTATGANAATYWHWQTGYHSHYDGRSLSDGH